MSSEENIYEATTGAIRVSVQPIYLEDESDPDAGKYMWAYVVNIANEGMDTVQLKSRHWMITDSNGHLEEVKGPGVVGEQPVLGPGEVFEYSSGTPLSTPSGIMRGFYDMETVEGKPFSVEIPAFSLDCPYTNRTIN